LTKVRRANHEVSFCHEHTQYTPICPKIMFWSFWSFSYRSKTSHPCGSIYANIGTSWQKFAARITKWVFATNTPNTLQYVQKSCFHAFWTFSNQSKTSHPWGHNIRQYWHKLTKVRRANNEVSFSHERTQYTPICPKIIFGDFWTFSFRSKTSHRWGLNICQYWH